MRGIWGAVATLALWGGVAQAQPLAPPPAQMGKVALTFDDLPGLSLFNDQAWVDFINRQLLRGLRRNHLPAIGFVNESKLDEGNRAHQIVNLKLWLDAGKDLGNHTFSHESPNDLGAKGYIEDIAKGEPVTRGLLAERGRKLGWFRHPYLETGAPEPVKRAINDWLGKHGYRIAPVTIDADDWMFAEPYEDALAHHDEVRRLRLRKQYLDYTERAISWYQKASDALFGRQIAFVMLLHDTRLNADSIDELSAILKRRKLRPVSLENAMRDPAYKTRDPYVGKDGIEWLERWSYELKKGLPWTSWQDAPKQIEEEYERLETDQHKN